MHRIPRLQVRSLPWTKALLYVTQSTGMLLGLVLIGGQIALAQPSPSTDEVLQRGASTIAVPDKLWEALRALDRSASEENLPSVLQYYSVDFKDGDGLDRAGLETVLQAFWTRYQALSYTTSIHSATQTPQGWILETHTQIEGMEMTEGRSLHLKSDIRARQTWREEQLVYQETLAERNTLTSGDAPPTISVYLPETVQINERFNFDVIIEEPVQEDLVLGAIVDEPISPNRYITPTIAEFQPLVSGGIFKIGQAPSQPDNRWISAVIIRKGGMTLVTQRLRILANVAN